MSIKWLVVIIFCAMAVITSAGANVDIYRESFDDPLSYDYQPLSSEPFFWSTPDGADMRLGTLDPPLHPGWVGRAIDMSTTLGGADGRRVYKNLPATMADNARHWVLSYDAYVTENTFNVLLGFGDTDLASVPNQAIVAMGYTGIYDNGVDPPTSPNWWFDARYVTGQSETGWISMPDDGTFRNKTVRVEIHVNAVNNEVYGTVSDGQGHTLDTRNTATLTSTADRECYIGALRAYVETWRGADAMDIDNILVEQIGVIPPGTLKGTISLDDLASTADLKLSPVKIELKQNGSVVRTDYVTLGTTGNSGSYQINFITAGTYDVVYSGCSWLPHTESAVYIEGPADTVRNVTLLNGDVNGDRQVTSTDLSAVLKNLN